MQKYRPSISKQLSARQGSNQKHCGLGNADTVYPVLSAVLEDNAYIHGEISKPSIG